MMKRKTIILLLAAAMFYAGCTSDDDLRVENERLRDQNRELRQMLYQYRKDTNRKQLLNLPK